MRRLRPRLEGREELRLSLRVVEGRQREVALRRRVVNDVMVVVWSFVGSSR